MKFRGTDTVGRYVLHLQTSSIGKVTKVDEPANGGPGKLYVEGCGDFWAHEEAFRVLEESESRFYLQVASLVRHITTECIKLGNSMGLSPASQRDLLVAAIQRALITIQSIQL